MQTRWQLDLGRPPPNWSPVSMARPGLHRGFWRRINNYNDPCDVCLRCLVMTLTAAASICLAPRRRRRRLAPMNKSSLMNAKVALRLWLDSEELVCGVWNILDSRGATSSLNFKSAASKLYFSSVSVFSIMGSSRSWLTEGAVSVHLTFSSYHHVGAVIHSLGQTWTHPGWIKQKIPTFVLGGELRKLSSYSSSTVVDDMDIRTDDTIQIIWILSKMISLSQQNNNKYSLTGRMCLTLGWWGL